MVKMGELKALVDAYEAHARMVRAGHEGIEYTARPLIAAVTSLFDVVDIGDHARHVATLSAIRGAMATTKHEDVLECLERALGAAEVRLADAIVRHIESVNSARPDLPDEAA
jgi:hypothetical protein